MPDRSGLLFIGDPHLSGRPPGFRKDDYPRVTLDKLRWSINYAIEQSLLPILLGDLFHFPRDNANWLLVELMQVLDPVRLGGPALAVPGNHDCRENTLRPDDTLAVLSAAGRLHLLDARGPWVGEMNHVTVTVGGTCWGQPLPESFAKTTDLVFWVTHHDLRFPGYEESARASCREVPGIDAVINGHIHRQLQDVTAGNTIWCNPGNVSRVSRGDACRAHQPALLRVDINADGWTRRRVAVPHLPFEEVFYPEVEGGEGPPDMMSEFVKGLRSLQQTRTADGQALWQFLDENLPAFEPGVADAIRRLAKEVITEARDGGGID
ncbi:MAG: metallophosphoesterase [Phycisphaerae bacterium]|nr:metallophosphoesterase [Phycisphaerae bacterium]